MNWLTSLDPVTLHWLQGLNNSWQRKGVTKGQSLQLPDLKPQKQRLKTGNILKRGTDTRKILLGLQLALQFQVKGIPRLDRQQIKAL